MLQDLLVIVGFWRLGTSDGHLGAGRCPPQSGPGHWQCYGSNMFNLLAVVGVARIIASIPVTAKNFVYAVLGAPA